VESPLQMIGAAEWAAARRIPVPVAIRSTAQMLDTAAALIARGAWFGPRSEWLGIPWRMLSGHRHWLVGDGFSGQFRLAAAVLRPERVTFLDDGANTPAFVDALTGRGPYRRPGVSESGLTTRVGPLAMDHVGRRAHAGDVEVFTAFDLGASRLDALADRGARVGRHRFDWTRRSAPPCDIRGRVILGSALPVDGRMPLAAYLDWVAVAAGSEGAVYLPHRRETARQRDAVARIPGVEVRVTGLPLEITLAGAADVDVLTLSSSAQTTLPLVLGERAAIRSAADRRAGEPA
jgi:hypothetical protein